MRVTFYSLSFALKPSMPGIMYYSILVIHLNRHSGACALCELYTSTCSYVCMPIPENQTSRWTNEKKKTCFHFEMVLRYISLIVHSHFSFGVYSILVLVFQISFFSLLFPHHNIESNYLFSIVHGAFRATTNKYNNKHPPSKEK